MVIDARGHEVPDGSDPWGYREDMEDLSESISSVRSVANQQAAVAAVAELVGAGINPAGTLWWFADSGLIYLRTAAGGWARVISQADTLLPIVAYGIATGITGKANAIRSRVVTLPTGRFPRVPIVMIQMGTGSTTAAVNTEIWVSSRKATSFTLNINRSNTTTLAVQWMAVYYAGAPEVPDFPDDDTGTLLAASMARSEPLADAPAAGVSDVEATSLRAGEAGESVTCHTEGCMNEGVPIEVTYDTSQPAPEVQCGACGKPITDIDPDEPVPGS